MIRELLNGLQTVTHESGGKWCEKLRPKIFLFLTVHNLLILLREIISVVKNFKNQKVLYFIFCANFRV
jgi:hypothetical protein